MKTKTMNPLKGLLLYFLYDAGGKLALLFLQSIAWGIAFLIWGGVILHFIFGVNAVAGVAMIVIVGMGNKEIDWERFQLSMPVIRRDLASSQFISVGLTPLVGIPLFVLFTALSAIFHADISFTFLTAFLSIAPFLAMPFVLGGLVFPLYSIKAAEKIHEGLYPVLLAISIAIPQLVVFGAGRLGWSMPVASALMLAVSVLIFVGSYFITRKLYAKMDF